jgi:hypothetical protein
MFVVVVGLEGRLRDCLSDFQLRFWTKQRRMTSRQARANKAKVNNCQVHWGKTGVKVNKTAGSLVYWESKPL